MSWLDFICLWTGYCVAVLALLAAVVEGLVMCVVAFHKAMKFFADRIWREIYIANELDKETKEQK